MGKWFGKIGYVIPVEISPGIWEEKDVEKEYYGEMRDLSRKLQNGEKVNDDIKLNVSISIIADPFAFDNLYSIRYIYVYGEKWKINDISVAYPRLNLTMGGLYNENTSRSSNNT